MRAGDRDRARGKKGEVGSVVDIICSFRKELKRYHHACLMAGCNATEKFIRHVVTGVCEGKVMGGSKRP